MSTLTKKKSSPITWEEAVAKYETHLRAARKAEGTVSGYLFVLKHFKLHLDRRDVPPSPSEVTVGDLRDYQCGLLTGLTAVWKRPFSAGTVGRVTTTLGSFFKFLTVEKLIPTDPTLRLERPRKPHRLPGDVLSVQEVKRLFGACDVTTPLGLRDRALIELFYATGLRRNEALALDLADLNHKERELTVRHGKGDKARIVPLTRSAWNQIMAYAQRSRPVLATKHADSSRALFLTKNGTRLGPIRVLMLFRELKAGARITKRLTPHTLRRTFATHLLKGDVNLRHIQVLLGHSNLNTTALYLRLNTKELRRELVLKHPRERFDA